MEQPQPVYINEDKLPDPERTWAGIRLGLQAHRNFRVVRDLPPEVTQRELRKSCNRSQEDLARQLGVTQARVSRIERCHNPRLRLLQSYVEALGGNLHLLVRLPGRDIRIRL